MSDKTLVERLRGFKPTGCVSFADFFGVNCHETNSCKECNMKIAHAIAEAIEREYLPRPRFEDGEPVQEGDSFEYMDYSTGPMKRIQLKAMFDSPGGEWGVRLMPGERVKRPDPEVLDADGVPIKVGDTVFNVKRGTEYKVTSLHSGIFEVGTINVDCNNAEGWHKPECLTHKQPDSLELVETDIAEWCIDHAVKGGIVPANEWVERIKALLERGR